MLIVENTIGPTALNVIVHRCRPQERIDSTQGSFFCGNINGSEDKLLLPDELLCHKPIFLDQHLMIFMRLRKMKGNHSGRLALCICGVSTPRMLVVTE